MNGSLWLTTDGNLYINGTQTTVTSPIWQIDNVTDVAILKFSSGGNLNISGTLYENT